MLAAGQAETASVIVKINPTTMKVTEVARRTDDQRIRSGTVAVEIGQQYWVGSYLGDRIGIFPAK